MQYQEWCKDWATKVYPKMKSGSFLFIFGARRTIHRAINAFEYSGFLLKDTLAWKKPSAHHRAQKVSIILERRQLKKEAKKWQGWRLGNLAPIWEPVAWFIKPYRIGGTITDNILENEVGAINIDQCKLKGSSPTNLLDFGFRKNETKIHEAQKPLDLIEYLIKLTTQENQLILDPFMGSGTTAVAAKMLRRNFIGFETNPKYHLQSLERIESITNNPDENIPLFQQTLLNETTQT